MAWRGMVKQEGGVYAVLHVATRKHKYEELDLSDGVQLGTLMSLYGACSVFFRAFRGGNFPPLSFEFPPQTITNSVVFFGYSSHLLSLQKQFPPPQNYISRKSPECLRCSLARWSLVSRFTRVFRVLLRPNWSLSCFILGQAPIST